MSCQQVPPRIAEDPYIFTETNSNVAVYNPQVHKLIPLINSPSSSVISPQQQSLSLSTNAAQKQFINQKSHFSLQNRTNNSLQINQQQQQQLSRINNGGISQVVNGLQKNIVTQNVTAGGYQKQFQIQCQKRQQQPTKLLGNVPKKLLTTYNPQLPPLSSVSSQQLNINEIKNQLPQNSPVYSIAAAKQQTITSIPLNSAITLPPAPIYQKSNITSKPNLLSKIDTDNQIQHNHSSTTNKQNQSSVNRNFQKFVPANSNFQNNNNSNNNYNQQIPVTNSSLNSSALSTNETLISTNNINNTSNNVIRGVSVGNNTSTTKKISQKKAVNLQNNDLKKQKLSSNENGKNLFLIPNNKKESKNSSLLSRKSIKKQSKTKKSNSTNNNLNSHSYHHYHHESLQRISSISSTLSSSSSTFVNEWHAPDSYIFDNVLPFSSYLNLNNCDDYDTAPCVQLHWLDVGDIIKSMPTSSSITREQRIELRKAQLRRQAMQNIFAQKFRTITNAKKRFICVLKALRKFKDRDETPPPKKCCFSTCSNNALALTAYCYLHITRNTDQYLFLPCTAKFSDNSQCRIPVFDISHELPLCREHAWKRDNYNRILQEQKPKKSRKRQKSISSSRPKKHKQKRRKTVSQTVIATKNDINHSNIINNSSNSNSNSIQETSSLISNNNAFSSSTSSSSSLLTTLSSLNCPHNVIPSLSNSPSTIASALTTIAEPTEDINNYITSHDLTSLNHFHHQIPITTQDLLTVCENSSAYESSEDTGVGGLSESELMVGAHDVIEEIPLGDTRLLEEHDLTNVLNQLPVDAFNELFTTVQQNGPLEPTQEEQEDLERALEAVNKQVKSLQQMTGGDSAFLGDFLDVDDQILDDTDICAEVVLNSPDTSGIDTSNILVDNSNNSNSVGSIISGISNRNGGGFGINGCNNDNGMLIGSGGDDGNSNSTKSTSDIRELVQTS